MAWSPGFRFLSCWLFAIHMTDIRRFLQNYIVVIALSMKSRQFSTPWCAALLFGRREQISWSSSIDTNCVWIKFGLHVHLSIPLRHYSRMMMCKCIFCFVLLMFTHICLSLSFLNILHNANLGMFCTSPYWGFILQKCFRINLQECVRINARQLNSNHAICADAYFAIFRMPQVIVTSLDAGAYEGVHRALPRSRR